MFLYQQSEATAAQRRVFIHLVDATDGITPETGEAAGQPQLSKNGAAFANTTATLTAVANGLYYVELTAAELDTLGIGAMRYKSANTAEAQVLIQIVPWDPYETTQSVNVTQWNGSAVAVPTVAGVPEVDVTHFGGTAGTFAGGRAEVNTSHVSGAIQTAGDIIADTNDIQARLPAALVGGRIDASVGAMAANVLTATAINADAITAAKVAADVSVEIAGAVWNEDATAHQTLGTFGQAIGDPVADANTIYGAVVTGATGATIAADIIAIDDFVDTEVAAILADTDDIQTRLPAALVGGRMDSSVGAYAAGMTPLRPSASGTADSGSTTTVVDIERTEADTDYWKGHLIKFTSGTLNGQTRLITAFDAATDTLTFAPALTVAAGTHTYEIYPAGRADLHFVLGVLINALIAGRIDANAQVVGDKTGYSIGAGGIANTAFAAAAIDAAAIAVDAIGASELAQGAAQEIADEMLNRDIAGGASGGSRNVRNAMRSLRNRVAISAGTATIYQEDDTTPAWTAAVTTTAGDPISQVDPA